MNANIYKLPQGLLRLFYDVVDFKTQKKLEREDIAHLVGELLTKLTTEYQIERRIRIQQEADASQYDSLWASEE